MSTKQAILAMTLIFVFVAFTGSAILAAITVDSLPVQPKGDPPLAVSGLCFVWIFCSVIGQILCLGGIVGLSIAALKAKAEPSEGAAR